MQRSAWLLGAVAAAGVTTSIVLYLQKRDLEAELAARPAAPAIAAAADPWAPAAATPGADSGRAAARAPFAMPRAPIRVSAPELPAAPQESRLERRVRRRAELAAMLGRLDGETVEQYRARMVPLITSALAKPRADVQELRAQLEAKAKVTPEQHQKLDAAFDKVYDDLLDYTNSAIGDRELDPYKSNVAGMLEYAGGLGTILDGANGSIAKILTPEQQRAFSDSGFEWAEYLGTQAPWEHLTPPPPPPSP